jgi:2-keto-4-pentenoate hydratase/2-oxohepta-3-ene-1,7-dioic acid hydratase in catechol pathway
VNPRSHRHLARYALGDTVHHGLVTPDGLLRLSAAPWAGGEPTGDRDPAAAVRMLAPCAPSKIVCIGLNYLEHVKESLTVTSAAKVPPHEPLFFLKPPSAATGSGAPIVYPRGVTRLDPEGEVAVVIGRRARHVAESEALACIAGVTAFNDVSARNFQQSDGQWTRAKGFDGFAPFGPVIALGLSPLDLAFSLRVNGETRQQARTSQMHFGIARLIAHVSGVMTLEPGDVIATGTPAGIAPVAPGDRVEVEVEGVGVLVNTIVSEGAA